MSCFLGSSRTGCRIEMGLRLLVVVKKRKFQTILTLVLFCLLFFSTKLPTTQVSSCRDNSLLSHKIIGKNNTKDFQQCSDGLEAIPLPLPTNVLVSELWNIILGSISNIFWPKIYPLFKIRITLVILTK